MTQPLILVRGGGDLASAVAFKLFRSGFPVAITEVAMPMVVRRTVSFAWAVTAGDTEVEGVCAVRSRDADATHRILSRDAIPVMVDPDMVCLPRLNPWAVIDATMAKKNRGMTRDLAPLTLALGPGFSAGRDVHAVIETMRGHFLGRIIYRGTAIPNTGIPESVCGYGAERVLRAPCRGRVVHHRDIGDRVCRGERICSVNDTVVTAPFDGMLRGLIMAGALVKRGTKIGDVDPRCDPSYCRTFSDKARAVAGGVLEAVLHHQAMCRRVLHHRVKYHESMQNGTDNQTRRINGHSCDNAPHVQTAGSAE